jgi:hypothetical protein
MDTDAYSVEEFCERHRISRAHFYNEVRDRRGPRLMKVGARTLITKEAAADWRREREHETAEQEAQDARAS